MPVEVVIYAGARYRRYPESKHLHLRAYFQSSNPRRGFLHRHKWEDAHGPIPDGYEIHHRDENTLNNEIDNLELVQTTWHRSYHLSKRSKTEEHKAHLESIRDLATEWHKSDEGREWHSGMAKRAWQKREPVQKTCLCCSGTFDTYFPSRANFCGQNCRNRYQRRGPDNKEAGLQPYGPRRSRVLCERCPDT